MRAHDPVRVRSRLLRRTFAHPLRGFLYRCVDVPGAAMTNACGALSRAVTLEIRRWQVVDHGDRFRP
jgi:hypothetical protein